jgi:hypothetical protein
MMMNFEQTPEFSRELKALSKKWRTLPSDLAIAQGAIAAIYAEEDLAMKASIRRAFFTGNRATVLSQSEKAEVVKIRLDCTSAGARNLLRLIFIAIISSDTIQFVELYAKNDKPRENKKRIEYYLNQL